MPQLLSVLKPNARQLASTWHMHACSRSHAARLALTWPQPPYSLSTKYLLPGSMRATCLTSCTKARWPSTPDSRALY